MSRFDHVKYESCPERYQGSLKLYIEEGYNPGDFLVAVLENDLFEAFGRADIESTELLGALVTWIYNYAPRKSWGSPEAVKAWVEQYWPAAGV